MTTEIAIQCSISYPLVSQWYMLNNEVCTKVPHLMHKLYSNIKTFDFHYRASWPLASFQPILSFLAERNLNFKFTLHFQWGSHWYIMFLNRQNGRPISSPAIVLMWWWHAQLHTKHSNRTYSDQMYWTLSSAIVVLMSIIIYNIYNCSTDTMYVYVLVMSQYEYDIFVITRVWGEAEDEC